MSTTGAAGSAKKRGHQHHPRNEGTRRRLAQDITTDKPLSDYSVNNVVTAQNSTINNGIKTNQNEEENTVIINSAFPNTTASSLIRSQLKESQLTVTPNKCDIEVIDLTNCDDEIIKDKEKEQSPSKSIKEDRNAKIRKQRKSRPSKNETQKDMCQIERPEAEGSSQSDIENEQGSILDPEIEELSKLRCTSEMTEVVAEREKRKNWRCADYPGLDFGSIFSSDTLFKFNIIKNELHNIKNTQLKRVGT